MTTKKVAFFANLSKNSSFLLQRKDAIQRVCGQLNMLVDFHDIYSLPNFNSCRKAHSFENFVAEIPDMPYSLDQYFSNQGGAYENYLGICSRIKRQIREDQIAGGMAGIYNPSITQRLNNLVDKQEHTVKAEQPLFNTDG